MEKLFRLGILLVLAINLGGCAGSLNSLQKAELQTYEAKGLTVTEKNPGVGAALGLLPGGGSFYTRHYGLGVLNLLLWPVSVLWDPINGYEASQSINYFVTKMSVSKRKEREIQELDDRMKGKEISTDDYLASKRAIEKKYSGDFE